ncbi:hypothetical protein [Allosalinactinospora lopnorensis]|uniref:hypothetical protein n=1 Tax=Allosalinactinospora lopnorensis TaxID=1352348 RepID=UPI00191C1084|nr:hypothetical protein [Allosalinactinospora lopnorensis]
MTEPVSESMWARPCRALRPYVDGYRGYRMQGFPSGLHQGLPSRHLTVILSLGPPVDIVRMPDPTQSPGSLTMFAGGLHTSPATIAHDGDQVGISLALSPLGARRVLGLPPAPLDRLLSSWPSCWGRGPRTCRSA